MSLDKLDYLCDVDSNKYFYAINSKVLKNMSDLYYFLKECDSSTFSYHVNANKNDFSAWVRDAFHDNDFADEISTILDRRQLKDILEAKLHNSSDFLRIEQDLLKRIKEILTLVEIKEKEYDKKKSSGEIDSGNLEYYSRLKTIKEVIDDILINLTQASAFSEKERSKRYVLISENLSKITKMLSLIEHKKEVTRYENQTHESKTEGLLLQIMNSMDKILKSNTEIFERRQKKMEDDLSCVKKDIAEWKIGDVADHQEIKSVFLAFEKNIDYKFDDINEFANKIKDLYYYDEKIKRHTTLITNLDKELFELKKEVKKNSNAIEKTYEILKEIADQLRDVSSANKKLKKKTSSEGIDSQTI